MPRAPFNTDCDVFEGPRGTNPNVLRGSCDCRLVVQNGIMMFGADKPIRVAWLTLDAVTPRGSWIQPAFSFDPGVADQIAVPMGTAKRFWVLYVDQINWQGQALYRRACLAELPLPGVNPLPPRVGSAMIIFGSNSSGPDVPAGSGGLIFGNA